MFSFFSHFFQFNFVLIPVPLCFQFLFIFSVLFQFCSCFVPIFFSLCVWFAACAVTWRSTTVRARDVNPIGGISKTDLRKFILYCCDHFHLPILRPVYLDIIRQSNGSKQISKTQANHEKNNKINKYPPFWTAWLLLFHSSFSTVLTFFHLFLDSWTSSRYSCYSVFVFAHFWFCL